MARLESVAVAGYYPTPAHLVTAIAARIDVTTTWQPIPSGDTRWGATYPTVALLDPAAGDGTALVACAQALFGDPFPTPGHGPQLRFYGVELEAERAQALAARLRAVGSRLGAALHSDSFQITWATDAHATGAQIVYLNPPYDLDVIHGRLEQAFLTRWTPALTPGGILIYIVPGYALAASAAYLAAEYEELHCYRFPDADFALYGQVVLLARRRSTPRLLAAGGGDRLSAQITAWGADAARLPVLPVPDAAPPDLALPVGVQGGFASFQAHPLDVQRLLRYSRPWTVGACDLITAPTAPIATGQRPAQRSNTLTPVAEVGVHQPLAQFLSRVLPVAMPPKPAYLALLLAAGMLNGLRVEPDDPAAGWPPILVKGRFRKDFVTIKESTDKQGRTTSQVQVQQPSLAVCILALTTPPRYVDLAPGTTPSGATNVDAMNIADLLQHYGRGLATLMAAQFPAQHDPTNPAHLLPLPALGRALFTAQAHVVQSTLKLLGQGQNPLILGQVGTGKSSMALAVAQALTPTHYATTRAALQAAGVWNARRPPRLVRRLLVLCPPHLVTSWTEQIEATLPGAAIVVVRQIPDLHTPPPLGSSGPGADLVVYLLSRETAKLGHAWRDALATQPAPGSCPRCGAPVTAIPERIVSKRLRCRHQPLQAQYPIGTLAGDLARLLLPVYPDDDTLRALVPNAWLRRAAGADVPPEEEPDTTEAATKETAPDAPELATQQELWTEQATRPWSATQTMLARLCSRLAAMITDLSQDTGDGSHERRRAVLRASLLLHLAAPAEIRAGLITQTVQHWAERLSSAETAPAWAELVREESLRLLMLLAPSDEGLIDRLLPALEPLPAGERFTPTRARLRVEATSAAGVASGQITSQEAREQAIRYATTSRGGDWWEFTIPAETGLLTWREGGASFALGSTAAAYRALEMLVSQSGFIPGPPCNEPLYQAVPTPRRVPLARYIARHCRWMFDLVVLDEVHEFNNVGSAQEHAAHLLAALPRTPVLGLTGSLMGGYSSSLFANFRAFSRTFRAEFGPQDKGKFVQRFGYLKILRTLPDKPRSSEVRAYGKASLRTELDEDPIIKVLGEAPGVLPLFLPQYLLPQASIIHKTDLEYALPPLREQPIGVAVADDDASGRELLARYEELQTALLTRIAGDRFTPLQGRLLGALTELPSFLDLATADVGNTLDGQGRPVYQVRYSANCGDSSGSLVASVPLLPATALLPKERWLLEQLREQLGRGRNVILYLRHTGNTRLVARYQRLLGLRLGVEAAYLDSSKVDTSRREDWIKREVIGRGQRVLLVNPESVKTGLNCLTPYFTTAIWMELTYNALTYRQANGRIHRIGSDPTTEIEIYVPAYAGTTQETAWALVARKVTVSTQMDGLDVESQLEAAGAGDDPSHALEVLSMGQALYEILAGQASTPQHLVPVPHVVSAPGPVRPVAPPAPSSPTPPRQAAGDTGQPRQLGLFEGAPSPSQIQPSSESRSDVPAARPQQLALFDLLDNAA